MPATVAVVKIHGDYARAIQTVLDCIGGLGELNSPTREVTIKVGIFDPRSRHHSSFPVVQALTAAFDQSARIWLVESDNYCGPALDRLKIYQELFDERIRPLNLSAGPSHNLTIAGEEMALSTALFKPNVFVSTHVLRSFSKGSILKNLFGCTPTIKKARYHKDNIYPVLLADIYEASGGIDLAVMDGTYLYHNAAEKYVETDILLAGRDAVAVETVGAILAGLKPEKIPVIQEFANRGLGEGDIERIEVVGISAAEFAELKQAHKALKKSVASAPRQPGISDTIDKLVEEGCLDQALSVDQVVAELLERGVNNANKTVVETTLKRRVGKSLERDKEGAAWLYHRKTS